MLRVGFIGAGTVGTAMAISLSRRGYGVVAVSSRSRSSAERLAARLEGCEAYADGQCVVEAAELVFVTTPDSAIGPVVSQCAWRAGKSVVHCSGADSLDVLEAARKSGASVGALHPLQTFASVEEAIENLPGSTFALEAEGLLLGTLEAMAKDLGGTCVRLGPGDKVLYHAAAVLTSNYMVALVSMATDLWKQFGVSTSEATDALLPLIRGTVNNITKVGLPNCLTGPIARGDLGTIEKHIKALAERAPGLLDAYRLLGLQTVPIALAKGRIDDQRAGEMRIMLQPNYCRRNEE
ncbi:MAG: DUF2520 domain-containing protein [Dehalococcoidia bacterium]|nr:DUF2520 domain-containing protein [Dehalococcoidia bacterium]